MKTKRFAKLAVLVLTAALLIGAVVGISISADGETTVAVAGKNISYEGALQVVYYIDVQNLADGQTLKMDFWLGEQGETPSYTKTFAGEDYKVEKDGKIYYSIFSNGIEPIYMTRPIIAEAYVVDAEGAELTRGEAVTYSVYDYAMNRFSQSPTSDQIALYTAFLDYGAAVQTIFGQAIAEEYGWADAYYNITENVYVDGVLDAEASLVPEKAMRPSELAEIGKISEGKYTLPLANSQIGTAIYKNTLDEKGDNRSFDQVAIPGVHTYNIYYSTGGFRNDMEGLTAVGSLFDGGKFSAGNNGSFYSDSGGHKVDDKSHASYMVIENQTGAGGAGSDTYLSAGTNATHVHGGGFKIDLNDGSNVEPLPGVVYVLDFDFKIAKFEYTGPADRRAVYFGINKSVNDFSDTGNSAADIADLSLYTTAENGTTSLKFHNDSNATINVGEWNDIHVEYNVVSSERALVYIYINGEFALTYASTNVATPETLRFEMRGSSNGMTDTEYHFDNIYFESYSYENIKGNGSYAGGLNSTDSSVVYSFDDASQLDAILGATSLSKNDSTKSAYVSIENGELLIGTNGDSSGYVNLLGPDNTGNNGTLGTKYVFETDFKFMGGTARESDKQLSYSIGLEADENSTNAAGSIVRYKLFQTEDGGLEFRTQSNTRDIVSSNATDHNFTLDAGKWYNIRITYEIVSDGTGVGGSDKRNAGKMYIYVNDELIVNEVHGQAATTPNNLFKSFFFQFNGTDVKYALDNLYMGIINVTGDRGTGVYYNKADTLVNATIYDFTDDKTIEAGDEVIENKNFTLGYHNPVTSTNNTAGSNLVITNSGELKVGAEGSDGWSTTVINAKNIAVAEQETFVFETDFVWLGSDAQGAYISYFYLKNSAGANVATFSINAYGDKDGTQVQMRSNKAVFDENEWHNIRIEVENLGGGLANIKYYLDNAAEPFDTELNKSVDVSAIKGLYVEVNPTRTPNQMYLFDNIVFANTKEKDAGVITYDSYYEAYQGGAVEYNGNRFSSAFVQNFDEIEEIEKGAGKLLAASSTADLNVKNPAETPSATTPFVNVTDGALNFGYDGPCGATSYNVDINIGQTAAVGQTYIIEYDFTFNGSVWDSKQAHLMLAAHIFTNQTTNGYGTMATWQGNRVNSDGNGTGTALTLAAPEYVTGRFTAGTTYKIRIEIAVTGEQTCTVNYYIDDIAVGTAQNKTNTTDTDTRNYLTVGVLRFQIYNVAQAEYTIDNLIVATVDPATAD